jgi:hypothetical protein
LAPGRLFSGVRGGGGPLTDPPVLFEGRDFKGTSVAAGRARGAACDFPFLAVFEVRLTGAPGIGRLPGAFVILRLRIIPGLRAFRIRAVTCFFLSPGTEPGKSTPREPARSTFRSHPRAVSASIARGVTPFFRWRRRALAALLRHVRERLPRTRTMSSEASPSPRLPPRGRMFPRSAPESPFIPGPNSTLRERMFSGGFRRESEGASEGSRSLAISTVSRAEAGLTERLAPGTSTGRP